MTKAPRDADAIQPRHNTLPAWLEPPPRALFLAALIASFVGYFLSGWAIADHDNLVMGEVARQVSEGSKLYIEAWDNKPPLTLLFYVVPMALAPRSYLAIQIFGFVWTALQAGLLLALLRPISQRMRYGAASLVMLMPLARWDFVWASSEDAANLFALVLTCGGYAVLVTRRSSAAHWALMGLATALVFHVRQPVAAFALLPLWALWVQSPTWGRRLRALLWFAGGVVSGFAIVVGVMLLVSDLSSYVDAMFVAPTRYRAVFSPEIVGKQLNLIRLEFLWLPFVLALILASDRAERVFAGLLALAPALAILAPMKEYGHYQEQLLPALIVALLIVFRSFEERLGAMVEVLGLVVFAYFGVNAAVTTGHLYVDRGELRPLQEVVAHVDNNARSGDTVFAMGNDSAYIYFRSKTPPVHRFHWDLFFRNHWLVPEEIDTVVDEILASPPRFVALDRRWAARYGAPPANSQEADNRLYGLFRRLTSEHDYIEDFASTQWVVLKQVQ